MELSPDLQVIQMIHSKRTPLHSGELSGPTEVIAIRAVYLGLLA